IDKQSLSQLDGTTVDYVRTNALHEGFEFSNPNVKDLCGCGESFRI
ncbi:MAG: iron-sulfur cluster assembly protein IscA, partial [Gammaproteobacteria bacterium]